jgi:hypothetical protein
MTDDALVDGLLGLMAERDRLEVEVAELRARLALVPAEADVVRRAYRRGYLTGRAAQRRGEPAVTNPERQARGWVRQAVVGPEITRLHDLGLSAREVAARLGVSADYVRHHLDVAASRGA